MKIRQALDKRDGDMQLLRRAKQYRKLSELASHATWRGFTMTTRQGIGELGSFIEPINLKAWLHEMVLRWIPSAVVYGNHFPQWILKLERFFQEFEQSLCSAFADLKLRLEAERFADYVE